MNQSSIKFYDLTPPPATIEARLDHIIALLEALLSGKAGEA